MEKAERDSLKKSPNSRKTMVRNEEIQPTDISSDDNSSDDEDDNENSETDDAGVRSWTMDEAIAFLVRIRPRKVYCTGSGFGVLSNRMGNEIEKWFGGGPKPQSIKIEDLKTMEMVTTDWELVKGDEKFQYKLKKMQPEGVNKSRDKGKKETK